jgi:voltage-gated potassium channel
MKSPESIRHLKIALILVLCVLVIGTAGYMLIEKLSFADALYTTVGMMATVGTPVRPLSPAGRLFTIGVIVLGVASLLYTFGAGMEFVIEGHFSEAVRRRFMENKIAALRNHSIVCGFGRVGSQIAEELAAARIRFVVLDDRENNVRACLDHNYLALLGDATSDILLREAGIERAKCVLVATDDDAHNISITLSARHLNNRLFIIARANHEETEEKLKLAGADRVLSPYTIAGHRMANLAIQPGVVEFFDTLTRAGGVEFAVEEVIVSPLSPLAGKTVQEAQHILSDGAMIVALKKSNGLVPGSRSEARIEPGEAIIAVGTPSQLAAIQRINSAQT